MGLIISNFIGHFVKVHMAISDVVYRKMEEIALQDAKVHAVSVAGDGSASDYGCGRFIRSTSSLVCKRPSYYGANSFSLTISGHVSNEHYLDSCPINDGYVTANGVVIKINEETILIVSVTKIAFVIEELTTNHLKNYGRVCSLFIESDANFSNGNADGFVVRVDVEMAVGNENDVEP